MLDDTHTKKSNPDWQKVELIEFLWNFAIKNVFRRTLILEHLIGKKGGEIHE